MLIKFFRSNQPASIVILPLVVLLVLFLSHGTNILQTDSSHAMPFFSLVLSWTGNLQWLNTLLVAVLICNNAFLLNFIVNKHEFLSAQSYLPALFFISLSLCCPEIQQLTPLLFSSFFVMLALDRMLTTYRKDSAFGQVFDAGLLIGIASMFYFPSTLFILWIWVALIILRPFIWREWVISFMGLIVPFLFAIVYYYWFDQLHLFWENKIVYPLVQRSIDFHIPKADFFLLTMIIILLLLAFNKLISSISTTTLKIRKALSLLLWLSLFTLLGTILMAPSMHIIYYSLLAVPLAVFFANYFLSFKKTWMAEALFILWLLAIVGAYF